MKRSAALVALIVMVLAPVLWVADAEARAGRGGTSGSRGSRGFSSPTSPTSPSRQTTAPATAPQPAPRPGWGGFGGMLGGLLLGGLIGGLLFGGGFGSGIGLLEILLVGALAWFAVRYIRSRQQPQPAAPAGFGASDDARQAAWQQPTAGYAGTAAVAEAPEAPADLERGLAHIRQMDPDFDPKRMADAASDVFFKVQAAWMARDMSGVADLLTPEMRNILQADCDRLRAERRINRLENIAVRTAEVTEAWQEAGHDYVTVHFLASLLDYTTDESGARVLDGSRTEPVKFEEYWTFVRPVGPRAFRLTAIQQA
jgi:predicted lipid-binding transport protein (Tim44 family)